MTQSRLIIDDQDPFDRLRLIPWWDQEKLLRAKVMVVGAGAIGNETIKNLAMLGVGTLVVVDKDTIDGTNLSRSILFSHADCGKPKAIIAAEAVQRIGLGTKVIPIVGDVQTTLGLSEFQDCDIVLGCLDNREARWWINRCCWRVGRPWIDAGIQELSGVIQWFGSREAPCYECGMKELDFQLIQARYSCPSLRHEEHQLGRIPTTATSASLIGAWQAQECIKYLHGLPMQWGQAQVFHGLTNHIYRTTLHTREDCMGHDPWSVTHHFSESFHARPAAELFAELFDALPLTNKPESAAIWLEREFIENVRCAACSWEKRIGRIRASLDHRDAICPHCEQLGSLELHYRIASDSPLAQLSLAQLGVPKRDWIRIETTNDQWLTVALDDLPQP